MKVQRHSNMQKRVEGLSQEETIIKFMPKVKQIARHVSTLMSFQSYYDDLVSTGLMGLMDAFDKFDPKNTASFSTYMSIRVRGSMIDEIRNQSWIPRSVITKSKDIEQVHDNFQKGLGRRATDQELSVELGVKEKDLHEYVKNAQLGRVLNLDDYRSFNDKDRQSLIETVDDLNGDPSETVDRIRMRELLESVTEHLKDKQREVIMMYYFDGLKNVEISHKLGISESRVCQLHRDALRLLRRNKDMQLLFKCLYKNNQAA